MAIIAVADGIQNGFTHRTFPEGFDVVHDETVLVMLLVVPQADCLPELVEVREKTSAIFVPLICRTRCFRRSVLEDHLGLGEKSAE